MMGDIKATRSSCGKGSGAENDKIANFGSGGSPICNRFAAELSSGGKIIPIICSIVESSAFRRVGESIEFEFP